MCTLATSDTHREKQALKRIAVAVGLNLAGRLLAECPLTRLFPACAIL